MSHESPAHIDDYSQKEVDKIFEREFLKPEAREEQAARALLKRTVETKEFKAHEDEFRKLEAVAANVDDTESEHSLETQLLKRQQEISNVLESTGLIGKALDTLRETADPTDVDNPFLETDPDRVVPYRMYTLDDKGTVVYGLRFIKNAADSESNLHELARDVPVYGTQREQVSPNEYVTNRVLAEPFEQRDMASLGIALDDLIHDFGNKLTLDLTTVEEPQNQEQR